jgi:hypothetical protein
VAAIVLQLLSFLVGGVRWWLLFRHVNGAIAFRQVWPSYYLGYSLTTFFPLSLVVIWPVLPTSELNQLSHTIAHRLARYLERQGLLERDAEHGTLSLNHSDEDPMDQLRGHSITYRIVVGPQQGRKVYTLHTLPGVEEAVRPRACS